MIKTIRAWGCSFTWGEGLDSARSLWQQSASTRAWPNLVAASLGTAVKNHAEPGASNVWISDQIIRGSYDQGDLVLVMWTWPERTTRNMQRPQPQHILANTRSDLFEHWLRVHTESDIRAQDQMFRLAARAHLGSLGIPLIELDVLDPSSSWSSYPMALDRAHPGPEWHQMIRDQILARVSDLTAN
jgi:hypothetical protein